MNSIAHRLPLNDQDRELLIWQVPNEVINGFRLSDFERRIGMSKERFCSLANSLRKFPERAEVTLDRDTVRVFKNALLETMSELDTEFQTRTGHELESATLVVAKLNAFLDEPIGGENN